MRTILKSVRWPLWVMFEGAALFAGWGVGADLGWAWGVAVVPLVNVLAALILWLQVCVIDAPTLDVIVTYTDGRTATVHGLSLAKAQAGQAFVQCLPGVASARLVRPTKHDRPHP